MRVRSFIGRAGSAVQHSVTTRAPENTRSSNDGDGSGGGGRGDGSNGSAAHLLRKTIPTFYLILARSLALSDSSSVQPPSLSLLHTLATELSSESPNRPSSVAWHVGDTTTLSGLSGVSASSLPFESIPFISFLNLSSSISVISARIVIQNLVTLSLGTNPYQELAESSH